MIFSSLDEMKKTFFTKAVFKEDTVHCRHTDPSFSFVDQCESAIPLVSMEILQRKFNLNF